MIVISFLLSRHYGLAQFGKYYDVENTSITLKNDKINAITIDKNENKWFGTDNGLTKFDGTNWITYTLPNNKINAISVDSLGYVWVGTDGGVFKFDGTKRSDYILKRGSQFVKIYSIAIDKSGYKWYATNYGLVMFNGTSYTDYPYEYMLGKTKCNTVAIDLLGNKWTGYDYMGGVRKMNNGYATTYNNDNIYWCDIKTIVVDEQDVKWIGTMGNGVTKFEGNYLTTYTTENSGLESNYVYSIAVDKQGNKWFGTGFGVSVFNGFGWSNYNLFNSGLKSLRVISIAIDQQGKKWFGTDDGVFMFDGVNWTSYSEKNRLANNFIKDIAIDSQLNKWFLHSGAVSKFDGSQWYSYYKDGIGQAFTIDSNGNKWFSTNILDGYGYMFYKFDGLNWAQYKTVSDKIILSLKTDSKGNIWFGTNGDGVLKFDGLNWVKYKIEEGLADDFVVKIEIDSEDNIWAATLEGVSKFDGNKWISYNTTNSGLASNNVISLKIDSKGNIWFGTSDMGVSKFDGTNWTTFSEEDGLIYHWIDDITEDLNGNLWFSSNYSYSIEKRGLSKFDGTNWMTYNNVELDHLEYKVNKWLKVNCLTADKSGNIWIGDEDGVILHETLNTIVYKDFGNSTNSFKAYPIPTSDMLIIEGLPDNKKTDITLCDLNGKIIKEFTSYSSKMKMDISDVVSGSYILIMSKQNDKPIKIIKK